jgi:hypothetical protein
MTEEEKLFLSMKEDLKNIDFLIATFYKMKEKIMIEEFIVDNEQAEGMASVLLAFPFIGKTEMSSQELTDVSSVILRLVKNYG